MPKPEPMAISEAIECQIGIIYVVKNVPNMKNLIKTKVQIKDGIYCKSKS